jgi:hypothetical protein
LREGAAENVSAALALTLVLTAVGGAQRPAKLASPGLAVVNIDAKVGEFYTEHVAQQLKLTGVEIITVREIQSLLGMERQRQLLGCSTDASSCIAELANALGADGVLLGDIARLGDRYTINLKVIGAESGRTLALFSDGVKSEEDVIDALTRGAAKLATDTSRVLGLAPPKLEALEKPAPVSLRKLAAVPAVAGVVLAAVGIGLLAWSESDYQNLQKGSPGADGPSLASRGPTNGVLGVTGVVVGCVAVAAAVVMFVLGAPAASPAPVSLSWALGPNGGGLVLSGVWP